MTKLGLREILLATAAALIGLALTGWLTAAVSVFFAPLALPILLVYGWVLYFFRDPERTVPEGAGLFVSPADGTVADITPIGDDSELGEPGTQIGVFMSVFSVHVNRMPCDGMVEQITHKPGAFMDVRDPAAFPRNESTTLRLQYVHDGETYPIVVRQIAGLVARRIVTCCQPGDEARRGERFGMIKFGSRLELSVPQRLLGEVRVQIGQKVAAGRNVLAAARESDDA